MRAVLPVMAIIALFGLVDSASGAETARSAYVGQQLRDIKALSGEDIAALRSGDGMGLAKAAELNGYPGPRHVLALLRELRLSDTQTAQVTAIRDQMSAAARPLGDELIDRERALDQLFAQRQITSERLIATTAAIGEIQGRLRAVHLAAHLETRAILSTEQIAQYDRLRGYTETSTPKRDHSTWHRH
jgi:Spy/CpxP family protein refolding chaperone